MGAPVTKEVSLHEFVDATFRPLAEQLAGAGLNEHLVIVDASQRGLLRIYSPQAPRERAASLDRLAEQLKAAAAELRKQPAPSIFSPGTLKLSGVQKL